MDSLTLAPGVDTYQEMPPEAAGLWEITTEDGSRLCFDLDAQQFLRQPDPRSAPVPGDGTWQRLLAIATAVKVGGPVTYHRGLFAYWTTPPVVSIRCLRGEELAAY